MKNAELIFTPLPLLTHLVPAVELAKLLIEHNDTLCVTFLIMKLPSDARAQSYSRSMSSNSSISQRIRFLHLSEPNFSLKAISPVVYFSQVIDSQKILVRNVVADITADLESKSSRLAGFVIDMFCSAMIDVADEFQVPAYAFYIVGAGTLATFHFHSLTDDSNKKGTDFSHLDPEAEIPIPAYTNPLPVKLLPSSFFDKEGLQVLLNLVRRLRETKGIMVNTFLELEPNSIKLLSVDEKLPPIYPVGPVINFEGIGGLNQGNEKIMTWLDNQPDSSVVFLCFGSGGSFKAAQVKEIAYALENSGQRFLWALRWPPAQSPLEVPGESEDLGEVLPEGFLRRTAGIGMVVPWAPQLQVLSHSGTGGFVTHCGWNSVLEGVSCGVPMAAWPMHSDQQLGAFLLVRELEMAVEIKMDYRWDFKNTDPAVVKAGEIENGIRKMMNLESKFRAKVKDMKEKARVSISKGGSSYIALRRVIEDLER